LAVENIRAFVLSPNRAEIEWRIPPTVGEDVSSDDDLWYEIHWRTEGAFTPNQRVKGEVTINYIIETHSP